MRIGFVNQGRIEDYAPDKAGAELTVFAFGAMGEVDYEKELKGETKYFEAAARLSRAAQTVVVCGCVTNTRGHKRKSAVVAENGKLLGVSDMLHVVGGGVSCGATLRVYDTKIGRMGVAVAEDLYFPETAKTLSLCGCDFIVCPFGACANDGLHTVLARASAFFYGVPVYFCGERKSVIAEPSGNTAFVDEQSPAFCEYTPRKQYRIVETRRSGLALKG